MKVILSWKYSKCYVDFENAIKFSENVDAFEDNRAWSSAINFCQLWQEWIWAAVNVLKSGPKISDRTKRHHKQLNLFHINIKLA